ncbi:MAG: hypothetical protein KDC90_19485, partial [Ignavibacteriae bacterium]|nr:hypothetical protein [Ignavibacteriota bacterium]
LESRRFYGKHKIEEKTNPFWKVEVLQNNNLIDIVQADENGNYNFNIPFTYGTTLIELHQYGPNGEHTQQRKMYQIPVNQIPEGEYEYSANFGRLITISENLFQASGAYGFNDWLTSEIGTDVFTNDFSNSSIYSKTSTRFFDGYVTNLTLAPNAFYELEVNSIFSDLASFNLGSKIYETNPKFNPTNIKNEFDGNLFIPFSISESLFSLLFRGSRAEFNDFNRYDFSVRTFYDINNFSPSIEYDYYALSRNNFSSSYLNFRLNYSFYLPSNIFGGNIIDSRLVYNINNSDVESFNITFATTFLQNYRIQLSHNINFNSNFSDTQLRVVFDLPFLRSNTNLSKSVFTQSVLGSVNYNNIFNDFDFHNRGMVGKSAAAIRFFLDENNNNLFERGEKQIEDMNVNINSIGNKRQLSNGSIVINDLEAYTKYDVTLIDKKSKNPLWFPVREKFSFISDPNHFKEVAIPFYEAAVVNGSVMKLVGDKEIPVEGINVIL